MVAKLDEKLQQHPWLFTIGAFTLYFILYSPVYSVISRSALVLSALPVFVTALAFGWKGGLIAGLLVLPTTPFLFWLSDNIDPFSFMARNFWASHVFIAIFGIIVGMLRNLQQALKTELEERKRIEKENRSLINELNDALENVKTLSGLLPICSSCKKIRDDKGYWNHLESYLEAHSEASFSHGLCQECSDDLYKNESWYKKMKKPSK